MADITEAYKIALEVAGEDEADRLRASIGLLEQKLKALYAQFKGTPTEFADAVVADASRLADLREELDRTTGAERRAADAAKLAARDAAAARRQAAQAAKDQAAAAKQAAKDEAQAARQAADVVVDAAHDEMAARKAAQSQVQGGTGAARLVGAERSGAKARLGLAGANILQDTIQGGSPAYAINNILGLANDGGIKALGGEFLEAAGGVRGLAAAFGTVATVAGGMFLTIDGGLKSARLDWSDLGDVVDRIAGGAFSGAQKQADSYFGSASKWVGSIVSTVADYATGWSDATAAVRDHKDELEKAADAAVAYGNARKVVGGLRGEVRRENEDRGQAFGSAFDDAAGAEGPAALIDRVVTARIGPGDGAKFKVDVPKVDEKGNPTGGSTQQETTERAQQTEALTKMLAGAVGGEVDSMNAIIRTLDGLGVETRGLRDAVGGVDAKEVARNEVKADQDRAKAREKAADDAAGEGYDAIDSALDETHKRAGELAKPLQDRFNLSTASGTVVTANMVKKKLTDAGVDRGEADRTAGAVLESLEKSFNEEVRERAGKLGTDKAGARQSIVDDAVLGAQHDRDQARKALGLDDKQRQSQVIYGSAAVRDYIQSGLGKDDTPKMTLEQIRQQNEKLDEANRLLMQISRKPNYAVFA